jgi:hypothetical protein
MKREHFICNDHAPAVLCTNNMPPLTAIAATRHTVGRIRQMQRHHSTHQHTERAVKCIYRFNVSIILLSCLTVLLSLPVFPNDDAYSECSHAFKAWADDGIGALIKGVPPSPEEVVAAPISGDISVTTHVKALPSFASRVNSLLFSDHNVDAHHQNVGGTPTTVGTSPLPIGAANAILQWWDPRRLFKGVDLSLGIADRIDTHTTTIAAAVNHIYYSATLLLCWGAVAARLLGIAVAVSITTAFMRYLGTPIAMTWVETLTAVSATMVWRIAPKQLSILEAVCVFVCWVLQHICVSLVAHHVNEKWLLRLHPHQNIYKAQWVMLVCLCGLLSMGMTMVLCVWAAWKMEI